MNELSTKLTKINFKWLIEHCTDKENWKKTWTLYDYDGFKSDMSLNAIDIEKSCLNIRIRGNGFWNYGTISIPLSDEHFNENVFKKKVYSCIEARIEEYERGKIFETQTYKDAEKKDDYAVKQSEKQINEYLDVIGIDNDEVREAYIEKKKSDLNYFKYREIVLKKFNKTVLTQNYAMLALMFDNKEEYENIMSLPNADENELKESYENIEYEYQEEINSLLENN